MRFDDSLATVLSADTSTVFGAAAGWRQLVDLLGRGRSGDTEAAIGRLRELRDMVPREVRAASARALAYATPSTALVRLFAEDDTAIAAPVLRTATLGTDDWLGILPSLSPTDRAVLRHRRDLPAAVVRGLESFGAADFVLADQAGSPAADDAVLLPDAPLDETPFVAVGEAARAIPVVAQALRQIGEPPAPSFEIADLVARIDAYQRRRTTPPVVEDHTAAPDRFRFATDETGVIRWVDGVARGPLIGVSLALTRVQATARLDAVASGALRRRTSFRDARLELGGDSAAAGGWRLAGEPVFDRATGRFAGIHGVARRPRAHEDARVIASDQLRQLVHEIRTPANAIAGFAELIGTELLGSVAPVYRERAAFIQRQAADLIDAIEDLDTAARLEGGALDLRIGTVDLAELVRRAAGGLAPLAAERGATLSVDTQPAIASVDDRAAARLVQRLLATLVAAAGPGERLRAQVAAKTRSARLTITRPRALAAIGGDGDGDALLSWAGHEEGEPLLGTGFALRLARKLAAELGGRLAIEPDRLILRLPLAQVRAVERTATQ